MRPRTTDGADTTWMRYPFLLADGIDRTEVQERLLARNVASRMVWTGNILRQPGFADIEHRAPTDGFPNANRVMDRSLSLPTHQSLTSDDVGYLVEVVDEVFSKPGLIRAVVRAVDARSWARWSARPLRSLIGAVSIAIAAAACGGSNAATPVTTGPSTTATTARLAQLHASTAPWTLAAAVANEVLLDRWTSAPPAWRPGRLQVVDRRRGAS